jgi:hypothetical protein
MRNDQKLSIDTTVKWMRTLRLPKRSARYRLKRTLRGGVVVGKRYNKTLSGTIGLGALVVGGGFLTWRNIHDFTPDKLAVVGVIVGVVLLCYSKLERRSRASEETYSLGYDIGYEAGYQEAHKANRPVVVDIQSRRCGNCGSEKVPVAVAPRES